MTLSSEHEAGLRLLISEIGRLHCIDLNQVRFCGDNSMKDSGSA
jgi:hypothetical protein